MPHSSGGGFHGGGFHGGGFHGGSGFHGGHSNYNLHRTSRFFFAGAHRYVYYHRFRPYVLYSNAEPGTNSVKKNWACTITLFIVLLLPILFILMTGLHFPKKLSTNYDTQIVLKDDGGRLSDEEKTKVRSSFKSFQSITGITPAFESTSWVTTMFWPYSLEDYAYSSYTTQFKDEKHWLIVYQGGSNWAFEGMQGNDTDDILTKNVTRKFNETFYNYLSNGTSVGDSLVKSFEVITPNIMDNSFCVDDDIMLPVSFWAIIAGVAFVGSIFSLVNAYHMEGATKMPEGSRLSKCPYCDSPYYTKTLKTCPKCGAPLDDEESTPKEEKPQTKGEDEFAIDSDQFKIDDDRF